MPECWRGLKDRGASLLDRTRKHFRIFDDLSWSDGETGTADEREEQFERCNVDPMVMTAEPICQSRNLLLHRQGTFLKPPCVTATPLGIPVEPEV